MSPLCILAFDTTTEICSVALMFNKYHIIVRSVFKPAQHAQNILLIINNILKESNKKISDINALAFSHGPGSFNGIRIGVSVAKSLSLSINIPIIGISSLNVLAEGARRKTKINKVMVAMHACTNNIYWAEYKFSNIKQYWLKSKELLTKSDKLSYIDIGNINEWTIAGDGWNYYADLINNEKIKNIFRHTLLPNARDVLSIAYFYFLKNKTKFLPKIKPIYLYNEY